MKQAVGFCLFWSIVFGAVHGFAADWPMWRYDANRTGVSPEKLPEKLYLQWICEYPALERAWPDEDRMEFDVAYEPIVAGKTLYFGSSWNDALTALDTDTGAEKWRFYADGPIRFAPAAARGKVYFVSDDGCLYCLDADSGTLVWKFRAAPSDRKVLGNTRLISVWPARGAPVVVDETLYFGAGIWSFEGIFIYALEADTGEVIWANDNCDVPFMLQPHHSPAFAGVTPQGYMTVSGDKLLVPNGRAVPACFDRHTGAFEYFHLDPNGHRGGYSVSAMGEYFFNPSSMYELETGKNVGIISDHVALTRDTVFALYRGRIQAFDFTKLVIEKHKDRGDRVYWKWDMQMRWRLDGEATNLIVAGKRVYANRPNGVFAIDIPGEGRDPKVSWEAKLEGAPRSILAADGKIFVVTEEGLIYCFGGEKTHPVTHNRADAPPMAVSDESAAKAAQILKETGVTEGYCLALNMGSVDLLLELARRSDLHIVAVEPDAESVAVLRRQLDAAPSYGGRVAVLPDNPLTSSLGKEEVSKKKPGLGKEEVSKKKPGLGKEEVSKKKPGLGKEEVSKKKPGLGKEEVSKEKPVFFPGGPPYWASLILCGLTSSLGKEEVSSKKPSFNDQQLTTNNWDSALFRPLRPYGGVACLWLSPGEHDAFAQAVASAGFAQAEVTRAGSLTLLRRVGALPGAANWTHQYGDVANTVVSKDARVRAPLGLLWFGGPSNVDILPRHGHGPSEQVVDGRLLIEGPDSLRALDVYTGRVLWEADLPGLGAAYDNTSHQPGANARGSNYVSVSDGIYVAYGAECLRLDPATGKLLNTLTLPVPEGASDPPEWGYIGVWDDLLIAGSGPVVFDEEIRGPTWNAISSKRIVALNRYTGEARWTREAQSAFRHNAIAAGAGKVFCLDRVTDALLERMARRGLDVEDDGRLLALDVRTGDEVWATSDNVFGTWLGYSEEYDILLQAGRRSRDMLRDEPGDRMIVYRAEDGNVVWDKAIAYDGPCMLHGDVIIAQEQAFSLLTGERIMRRHPLTGVETPWQWKRNYGCNSAIAGQHLVMFRSAAAGFFDMERDGGTGNLGGFKSGCTSNLIAAGGVLNAPDYTRTCTCSYQNQTSLAFVYTPSVEMWTFNDFDIGDEPLRRVGINLGAPGDRRADNGTLWLDYPSVGGPSPKLAIEVTPDKPKWFRRHSLRMRGEGLNWVAASGGKDIASLCVTLSENAAAERPYTVRLHFAEPDRIAPGQRVFDVTLQGETVLDRFDVVQEAGEALRAVVKEFGGIGVKEALTVTLTSTSQSSATSGGTVLCGVEIVEEQ